MLTFLKANVSSAVASIIDYFIAVSAVYFFKTDPILASLTGTVTGGIVNFLMGRHWTFRATHSSSYGQAAKYLLVWAGNLVLNTGGMYLFVKYTPIHFVAAKLATSVLVAIGYNYPLQKKYVFKNN